MLLRTIKAAEIPPVQKGACPHLQRRFALKGEGGEVSPSKLTSGSQSSRRGELLHRMRFFTFMRNFSTRCEGDNHILGKVKGMILLGNHMTLAEREDRVRKLRSVSGMFHNEGSRTSIKVVFLVKGGSSLTKKGFAARTRKAFSASSREQPVENHR